MKSILRIIGAALLAVSLSAHAQFTPGQILTASQLNSALASKTNNAAAAITGGSITGLSAPIPLDSGGTGANTAIGATSSIQFQNTSSLSVVRPVSDKLGDVISVFDFMTQTQIADVKSGAHSLDASSSIQAALNAGGTVTLGSYTYRLSSGITVPAGTFLTSNVGMAANVAGTGATLKCDLGVATCVTVGGPSVNNVGTGLIGVNVARASGAIPAGSIGVLVQNVYNPTIAYVNSTNSSICAEFSNGGTAGISASINQLTTGGCPDAHLVINSWPELRVVNSRFGQNGVMDQTSNAYVRITGGSTTVATSGPNSLYFANTQFNQGQNKAGCWLQFSGQTAGSISDTEDFSFTNIHVEGVSNNYICSDSTWPSITRLKISNAQFGSGVEFFALNGATQINNWQIANSFFAGSFTLAPALQINFLSLANNQFIGAASLTGISGSVTTLTGNTYQAGLTLAGAWARLSDVGDIVAGGALSNTATGTFNVLIPGVTGLTSNDFSLSKSAPNLNINDTSGSNASTVTLQQSGTTQWTFASSASHNFNFGRYASGALVDNPISIASATGIVTMPDGLVLQGTTVRPNLSGATPSIGGSALTAGACTSGTVSVTGSTTAMSVSASPVTYPGDGIFWSGYVSAAGTVTVKVCAAVAATPTASTYNVRVLQ